MKEENLTNQTVENAPEQEASSTLEDTIYTSHDVYETQSSQDIYSTPDIWTDDRDTGGVFSGNSFSSQDEGSQSGNPQNGNTQYGNNPNGNIQYGNNLNGNAQYGNNPNGNIQYGNNPNGNTQYGNNPNGNIQYGNNPNGNAQYGNNPNGNIQYGNNPNGNAQYGNNSYGNSQNGNNPYGNPQYGNNPYGNPTYGNLNGYNPYGNGGPYSPYAMPQKKKNTGLIIGVIITVGVLFFIALFALLYHTFETISDRKQAVSYRDIVPEYYKDSDNDRSSHNSDHDDDSQGSGLHRDEYDNDHDSDHDDDDDDHTQDDDDRKDDHDYDSDEYYTLHDDVKDNLSYTIEWDYYEYDPKDEDVLIMVDYPVVVGSHVPNLDTINEAIENEVSFIRDFYFDEYSNYMYDDDSYFGAYSAGYVTYMSEDILSIVFSEYVYSDYFDSAYLCCFNIDMQNGVILDNTDIISIDDDFSVDFRVRSDRQNGTIREVDRMTDQEITELLTSSNNLIIYYTPQGMEIGFNYDEGWVTVTYSDYKDFLKIF